MTENDTNANFFFSFYVIVPNVETLPHSKMIEVTCNDRLGKKVRVKCKYPLNAWTVYSIGF